MSEVKEQKFKCTECGGDATIGLSKFKDIINNKIIIKKNERLCLRCGKKRGV